MFPSIHTHLYYKYPRIVHELVLAPIRHLKPNHVYLMMANKSSTNLSSVFACILQHNTIMESYPNYMIQYLDFSCMFRCLYALQCPAAKSECSAFFFLRELISASSLGEFLFCWVSAKLHLRLFILICIDVREGY